MMTDLNWNDFCELYYDSARTYAEVHLQRLVKKNGVPDKRVDLEYVKDAAVLSSLEKAFAHYDSNRGAKITTYLSILVHNEIVDEMTRETKKAAVQQDVDDFRTAVRAYVEDDSPEAREKLIPRLRAAIEKLSPSDQVILNYYLEDKSSYVSRSVEALHVTENYVSVRRHHIFKRLPKLMEMTRSEYMRYCYELPDTVFAKISFNSSVVRRVLLPNPIVPSLDVDRMAGELVSLLLSRRVDFRDTDFP